MSIAKSTKTTFWTWTGICAAVAALHIWSLMRYPEPFVDEAWLVSRAWSFIQTGHAFGPLDAGIAEQYPGYWVVNQWLVTFLQSLFLRLSPSPALFPLRLESLILGGLLLYLTYILADRIGGAPLARSSTLILGLSRSFVISAHMARYDIYVAVFGYAAVVLVGVKLQKRWIATFAGGLLAGLALDLHLNAILFVPLALLFFYLEDGWRMIRKAAFWSFCGGYLSGFLFYLVVQVLPSPQTYFTLNQFLFGKTHLPPALHPAALWTSFQETLSLSTAALTFFILILPFAVYWLLKEKTSPDRTILWVNLCIVLGVLLIFPQKSIFYSILIAPVFSLLIGKYVIAVFSAPWTGTFWNYASRSWISGVVIGTIFFNLSPLRTDDWRIYREAQAHIDHTIQADDHIMGTQTYWLGLTNHSYYSWEILFQYCRLNPCTDLSAAFNHFKPDVFIVDQPMDNYIQSEENTGAPHLQFPGPHTALQTYLNSHAVSMDKIDNAIYGPIYVYRLNGSLP